jgi:hypothetical protein
MPLRLATVDDINAMHLVRLAVRENALSDQNRVRPDHYQAMLQESGRGWVHEESGKVVAFGIADRARRNIWRCSLHRVLSVRVLAANFL